MNRMMILFLWCFFISATAKSQKAPIETGLAFSYRTLANTQFKLSKVALAPVISLISPVGSNFVSGSTIVFEISASDPNGIQHVEFYINGELAEDLTAPPYRVEAEDAPSGNYVFKFIVYNNSNQSSTTGDISITISVPPPNMPWNTAGNADLTSLSFLGTTDNQALIFKTNNLERLRLLTNGYFGVNNPNPLASLDVTGNIKASGKIAIGTPIDPTIDSFALAVNGSAIFNKVKVKLRSSGWPDYVFHPSYTIPSLSQVERFVKTNRHLPGIPAAEEVRTNGIDLGENEMLLLKKIEELTLYLIDQNKMLQRQQKELEKLKRKMHKMLSK